MTEDELKKLVCPELSEPSRGGVLGVMCLGSECAWFRRRILAEPYTTGRTEPAVTERAWCGMAGEPPE